MVHWTSNLWAGHAKILLNRRCVCSHERTCCKRAMFRKWHSFAHNLFNFYHHVYVPCSVIHDFYLNQHIVLSLSKFIFKENLSFVEPVTVFSDTKIKTNLWLYKLKIAISFKMLILIPLNIISLITSDAHFTLGNICYFG